MEIRIPKEESDKLVAVLSTLTSYWPEKKDSLHNFVRDCKDGIDLSLSPLVWERTRPQEKYYRKWAREFGKYCGMTEGEIHEELLCLCYGCEIVETKFGIRRRPVRRSSETNRVTYGELIDCLVQTASEMDFDIPLPSK